MLINQLRIFLLPVLFSITIIESFSQLSIYPILHSKASQVQANTRTLAKIDTIDLPFWDDFSTVSIDPDSAFWSFGRDLQISAHIGLRSPTINVASFDGVDGDGNPYNPASDLVAPTDSLVSNPVDMTSVPSFKQNTVYFSFYWQMGGLGDFPDNEDSLRLQFYNADRLWITQWVKIGKAENLSEDFQKEMIQVSDEQFFHSGFQFRFQSFGNTTGPFDTWHIDYVYLNRGRVLNEELFDHALASAPTPLFKEYTMMPFSQLFAFPDTMIQALKFEVSSFEFGFNPAFYTWNLIDTLSNTQIFSETIATTQAPLTRTTVTTSVLSLSLFDPSADSLLLLSEILLNTGDEYFISSINNNGNDTTFLIDEDYNYRLNDTIRQYIAIHETLAYDDGTAEFAAGLNVNEGEIAVLFELATADTLTHVDILFPPIKPLATGEPFDLTIYNSLSGESGAILSRQEFRVRLAPSINEFSRYELEVPVIISGEFYVGFQQFIDNPIGIGLDNNNLRGNKIFVNTGEWEPNLQVEGAIMIRPIFKENDLIVSAIDQPENELSVYPNPVDRTLNVHSCCPTKFKIFSLSGLLLRSGSEKEIDLSTLSDGLYLLETKIGQKTKMTKVVVRH